MSRRESKQIVKNLYAAFTQGDIAMVLALIAEDVIWQLPGTVPHYSGTYNGRSSVADFFQELNRSIEIESFEPGEFLSEGDRVLVTGSSRGRAKSTARMFDNRWVMAFTFCDGKIAKFEEYADTQALASAHDAHSRTAGDLLGE